MAVLDLTLSRLILPGLQNFNPDFGTKLPEGEKVSTESMCGDFMLPYNLQRPLSVVENSSTGNIEADSRLSIENSGITLTLGRATFAGCRVELYGAYNIGNSTVTFDKDENSTSSIVLAPGERVELVADGARFFTMRQRTIGGEVMNVSLAHTNILTDTPRFLIFDFGDANHRSLKIKKHTHIPLDVTVNGAVTRRWFDTADDDVSVDLDSMITEAANNAVEDIGVENGRDFYVYLVAESDGSVGIRISTNSTAPSDIDPEWTTANTRQIGQFHTLCVAAGDSLTATIATENGSVAVDGTVPVKNIPENDEDGFYVFYNKRVTAVISDANYDTVTVEHPLRGFNAGQILPESVWCITFRPVSCKADGMAYDPDTDTAVDIYLQSGKGRSTKSKYGGTTARSRQPINHQADMLAVGKRLPTDNEFLSFAAGSNEKTAIQGAAESSIITTGGHVDTANRRMVSFIGCEDCCGAIWQWLDEIAADGGSGFSTYDGNASFGQTYGVPFVLGAGGAWNRGSGCGSRSRSAGDSRSGVNANYGCRGSSRVVRSAR